MKKFTLKELEVMTVPIKQENTTNVIYTYICPSHAINAAKEVHSCMVCVSLMDMQHMSDILSLPLVVHLNSYTDLTEKEVQVSDVYFYRNNQHPYLSQDVQLKR
jgi:chorismate mutase